MKKMCRVTFLKIYIHVEMFVRRLFMSSTLSKKHAKLFHTEFNSWESLSDSLFKCVSQSAVHHSQKLSITYRKFPKYSDIPQKLL